MMEEVEVEALLVMKISVVGARGYLIIKTKHFDSNAILHTYLTVAPNGLERPAQNFTQW